MTNLQAVTDIIFITKRDNMYTKEQVQKEAQRLFNEYCLAIRTEEDDSGYFTNVKYAKDCAYIAIDEIIKQLNLVDACEQRDYWINVQYELDNMKL